MHFSHSISYKKYWWGESLGLHKIIKLALNTTDRHTPDNKVDACKISFSTRFFNFYYSSMRFDILDLQDFPLLAAVLQPPQSRFNCVNSSLSSLGKATNHPRKTIQCSHSRVSYQRQTFDFPAVSSRQYSTSTPSSSGPYLTSSSSPSHTCYQRLNCKK